MTSDATGASAMLSVRGLVAGYGHSAVLHGLDIGVAPGEIVTLIGANGAGKSTLMKTLAGLLRPTGGSVHLSGENVTGLPPELLVRRGMSLVPEGRLLFGPMTVEENLLLGAHTRARAGAGVAEDIGRMVQLFPVLGERRDQAAETLSGGEQQMLAVARSLMSHPRVLLLDEPSLGLAPKVIADIFSVLDTLRTEGLAILLVEQDARLALKHADRGYVIRTGSIALAGASADLLADDEVRHIYLGIHDEEGTD